MIIKARKVSFFFFMYILYQVSDITARPKYVKQLLNYYKHYTGQNRGAREEKHLMINSEMFGVEGTVNIIKNAVMEKFF